MSDPTIISIVAWTPRPFTSDEYEAMCATLKRLHDVIIKDISETDGLSFMVSEKGKLTEVDWS